MKLALGISWTFEARRHIELRAFLCVASLCILTGYGARAVAQVPVKTPRNGPEGGSGAIAPSVLKAREDSLRKRAEEFYQLLQSGRMEQAAAYVTPESKEAFRREKAGGFLGFKVDSVRLEPGGRKATVVVSMQVIVPHMVSPATIPRQTSWEWVDGSWYLGVGGSTEQAGDMRTLFNGAGVQKSQTPPGDLKFKDNRFVMGRDPTWTGDGGPVSIFQHLGSSGHANQYRHVL